MFCPKCHAEYREGFTKCSDCHIDLVSKLPPLPKPEYANTVVVFTSSNVLEANLVKTLLEGSGIEVFLQDANLAGLYPYALGGIKLAVRKDYAGKAESVLKEYRAKEGLYPKEGSNSPLNI